MRERWGVAGGRASAMLAAGLVCLLLVLATVSSPLAAMAQETQLSKGKFTFETFPRYYYLYVPPSYDPRKPTPLVIVLHGSEIDAQGMCKLTGFNEEAEKRQAICVYPESVKGTWNDGRKLDWAHHYNDVGFIDELINVLERKWNVDRTRVFVTGMANGGFFAQYLALRLPGKFAAVASVAASLPEIVISQERSKHPVSVMLILGMADPVIPWQGGPIAPKKFRKERGIVASASRVVEFWVKTNGCRGDFQETELPNADDADGTKVKLLRYSSCSKGAEVVVYGIEGGGHAWPAVRPVAGGEGNTCRDFDATLAIWQFFDKH